MDPKRICIVDDHKIVRDAVRAFLIGQTDLVLTCEAGSGADFLNSLPELDVDIVLLDLNLPDMNGLSLIEPVKSGFPDTKLLVLSAEMDEELLCEAVQLGADGFMHKDVSSVELLNAIRMVLQGEPWFGQNLSQLVYRSFCRKVKEVSETSLLSSISERELEVIRLLGEGLAIKEIGDKLCISPRTVETHKKNLLEKLGLSNTVALIKYGIRHRIISI